ncbi:MAG: thiamine biosynthesis protein ThiS [Chloroflexi bacterium]|nr:thiamine biosynthesis protein ThiS [Chloroflexota bacterium]|tara:strand:+ start:1177 stop:1410 length:234 start_codon:yes stop_codon:yes gene_type:complete
MKISEVEMDLMSVFVNGKKIELVSGVSLLEYLESNDLMNQTAFAVALNQEIIQRDNYGLKILAEGDRVEIVKAIGGG